MKLNRRNDALDDYRTTPKSLPDVSTEHHTMVPNEWFGALMAVRGVTLSEFRVLLAIARLSYGFRRPTTDNYAWGSNLQRMTGLDAPAVSRTTRALARRRMVIEVTRPLSRKGRSKVAVEYALEPDWRRWLSKDGDSALPATFVPMFRSEKREDGFDASEWEDD